MAIKYNTKTPKGDYDEDAKDKVEWMKKVLVFTQCRKCDKDSEIKFVVVDDTDHSKTVDWQLKACCSDFAEEVMKKLTEFGG